VESAPLSIYVHIPFCPTKCGYCDFNSYAGSSDELVERTVLATIREIERTPWGGRPASTIFFGGGTPTSLSVEQITSILDAVRSVHPAVENCEITSEANPGTVDASKFSGMREAGFNRVSLGAQSFLDSDLIVLGRIHRAGEIERAVSAAREAGFDNLNLDLMFALPHQSLVAWERNLDRALALRPEHLSLYCLTLEPNTPFYKAHLRGELVQPDDEDQVAMYDSCRNRIGEAGYGQYEISNYCLPGRECHHNMAYWHGLQYAGYGPGAVGCVDGVRYTNLKLPARYSEAVETGAAIAYESETLTDSNRRMETIMLGLRLNEGLDATLVSVDPDGLRRVVAQAWVDDADGHLRLTDAGRHFCSEVALALI
jgi:oxygen-independent coproporphyrinogen-3 oxidase